MKYSQLLNIQSGLIGLGKYNIPISYEVAKNLNRVNKVIEEVQKTIIDLHKKFADKDTNGNVQYETTDRNMIPKFEKNKDNFNLFQEQIKKIDEDDTYKVDFHKISAKKIETMLKNEKYQVAGEYLSPLIGSIIEEDEDNKKTPEKKDSEE